MVFFAASGAALQKLFQRIDPRWFQLLFLASILSLGALARDFALTLNQVLLTFVAALLTQAAWQWGLALPTKAHWSGYLSALITGFGISILVRAETAWVHPLLACVATTSKYVIRSSWSPRVLCRPSAGPALLGAARRCTQVPPSVKSHVLNPANLAAFAAWAWVPGAWLSPGQWGSESLAALWFLALGGLVTQRVSRWDVSLGFLATWALLLGGHLVWLGYAWNPGAEMWAQQLSNGAVLLFAFFMVSDPMTTPQRRGARIAYAVLVAVAAFAWQYLLYKPHGLIVILFLASWTVPLWNLAWPQRRFEWQSG